MAVGIKRPRFVWGPTKSNTLDLDYSMSEAFATSRPKQGYETARALGGNSVAHWNYGFEYLINIVLRFISTEQWDGPTGFKSFIADAMRGREFDFYPDRDDDPTTSYPCVLISPSVVDDYGELENDGRKRVMMQMRTTNGQHIRGI